MSEDTDAPSDADPADLLPLLVELSSQKQAPARAAPSRTASRPARASRAEPPAPSDDGVKEDDAAEEIEPRYSNLNAWVTEWFAPIIERRLQSGRGSTPGLYWCESWWDHPEAIFRLYGIWREWEKARAADTMSAWARDHLDPHLAALTSELGPFARCEPGSSDHDAEHNKLDPLPVKPAPASVLAKLPDWDQKNDTAEVTSG